MLAAICTGILSGLGFALIYMRDSSTGGADFIILSLKSFRPHLTIGRISFALDAGIVSQNISLFCSGTGLVTVPRASMDQAKLKSGLKLKDTQRPLINHPVGYAK